MNSFPSAGGLRKGSVRRSARWAVPMTPAIVLIGAFLAVPIGYSVYLSLTNTRLTGVEARAPKFIGLDNFTKLFGSDAFPKAAWLTLFFVVGSALIGQNLLGGHTATPRRLPQQRVWRGGSVERGPFAGGSSQGKLTGQDA